MAVGTTELQTGTEVLRKIGKDATNGRGVLQSGENFLQGGGTGSALIRLIFLNPVNGNIWNGGRDKHQVPEINHRGWAQQREDRMLFTPAAEEVWEVVGTQLERSYISHRQGMESHWVALRPIFEVCTR